MEFMKRIAVIVPIYKESLTLFEEFSFYRNANILSNRDIFLLGPRRMKSYLFELKKTIPNGNVCIVDDKFFNNKLSGNSRLMLSYDLYNNFKSYDFMLICHFDCILFEDQLDYWMLQGYDNIGAPLFRNKRNDSISLRMGNNGGLCLRNIKSCLKILSRIKYTYSNISILWQMEDRLEWKIFRILRDGLLFNYKWSILRPLIHEDMFWSVLAPRQFPWFKNAPFEKAKYFAFEEKPDKLFEMTNHTFPFGIHAWWKNDKNFCLKMIEDYDSRMNNNFVQNNISNKTVAPNTELFKTLSNDREFL